MAVSMPRTLPRKAALRPATRSCMPARRSLIGGGSSPTSLGSPLGSIRTSVNFSRASSSSSERGWAWSASLRASSTRAIHWPISSSVSPASASTGLTSGLSTARRSAPSTSSTVRSPARVARSCSGSKAAETSSSRSIVRMMGVASGSDMKLSRASCRRSRYSSSASGS